MPGAVTLSAAALDPGPILGRAAAWRGSIVDLDAGRTFGPDAFARGREALETRLQRAWLGPGDRVLVALPNGASFVAAVTAVLACGASPLVVHAQTPAAELLRTARRFGVRFLATVPGAEPHLGDVLQGSKVVPVEDLGTELLWGALDVGEECFRGPELRSVPLHPTSGSTGLPKIALRPGFAAMEEARHYVETMGIGAEDRIVAFPPMSHAYAWGMCVMVPLLTGAGIVCAQKFSAARLAQAIEEAGATILPTVPAALDALLFGRVPDVSRLRWILAAGSPLQRRAAERFRERTGRVVCPLYGTTETGGISVATAASGRDVDGRVGPAMRGVEVEVRPGGADEDLGPGTGRLFVRSSSMMTGYLDDTGAVRTGGEEGWFETGDLARLEADGTIHLRGRTSEVVNVAGLKVVPCEVEDVILGLPGVREVKVYAGEHVSGTQIVKAAVAVEPGVAAADVRAHCARHLVYYKRPQFVAVVEALPRTPSGKIVRAELP